MGGREVREGENFLGFETIGFERDLSGSSGSPNPKNLADLPSSRTPCESRKSRAVPAGAAQPALWPAVATGGDGQGGRDGAYTGGSTWT